ncbi:MAG TPA: isoaspartyl peptidase/L-asparaginase [Phycisphaerales bacterium]|nr:isoaspartyl peptidase/L-asparaginase [Phycisphaerales bacterium]
MPVPKVPVMVSTWSMALRGHEAAWPALADSGDAIDAVETVCQTAEDDPKIDSVGFGGLPDANGNVTVDGCIMRSPASMGGVAAMQHHRHAVTVARQVMDGSKHILLVGPDADAFADAHGIAPTPMCSDAAHATWAAWKHDGTMPDQGLDQSLIPVDSPDGALFTRGEVQGPHDTIGTLAIGCDGVMAGACSTSGMPFKAPGRVGDSPIIGHGLYVDPGVGAAVATGVGELVSATCGAFLAVDALRRGSSPIEAAHLVIERIKAVANPSKDDQVAVIVLTSDGCIGSAALRPGFRVTRSTVAGHQCTHPDVEYGV